MMMLMTTMNSSTSIWDELTSKESVWWYRCPWFTKIYVHPFPSPFTKLMNVEYLEYWNIFKYSIMHYRLSISFSYSKRRIIIYSVDNQSMLCRCTWLKSTYLLYEWIYDKLISRYNSSQTNTQTRTETCIWNTKVYQFKSHHKMK